MKHRAQFVKSEGTRKYIWLSVVTFVQQFQRSSLVPSALDSTEMQERLLLLPFHITWSSNVTNDGRFRDYNLLNHELKNNEFRMPTDEDRKNWDLKILKS